jgi:prepilin-type N-terminal cleavage/methylation domain-containing protein
VSRTAAAHRRVADDAGFTLVEVIVAAMILVVGMLGVATLLESAQRATARTKAREAATNLAREAIEAGRAVPYPDLIPSRLVSQLQAQPGLADAQPDSTWQIRRRGIVFTLTASVCSVDEGGSTGTDGYGVHTGLTFCSDSTVPAGAPTPDSNPDDYKRLKIDVSWTQGSTTRTLRQEAVINNPGSAFAPAVKALTTATALPITVAPAGNQVTFTATTSTSAQQLTWAVDGVERGIVNGPASSFSFAWDLNGVVDGTYLVSAQAFDRYGETGAGRTVTVLLNVAAPLAPTGVTGSRNPLWNNLVELEWNPSPERDVTTYKVFRQKSAAPNPANDDLICTRSVDGSNATSCQDTNAPGGGPKYYVVAYAPSHTGGTGLEPGATSTPVDTGMANLAPLAPGALTATRLPGDGVQLSWPAAADPDGSIRYYRIYRDDNSSYTKRIDRTGSGSDLSWTDDSAGAADHAYWVTAVDNALAESTFTPSGAGVTAP